RPKDLPPAATSAGATNVTFGAVRPRLRPACNPTASGVKTNDTAGSDSHVACRSSPESRSGNSASAPKPSIDLHHQRVDPARSAKQVKRQLEVGRVAGIFILTKIIKHK